MHKIERLRDNLCEELEKVARKDEISTSDLDIIDKLAHSIKNIDKVLMYDEYSHEGHSYGGHGYNNNSYARQGRDGDNDGRYNEGRSRADHSYDYSRYYRDRMTDKLRQMMNDTSNDRERDAIMRCISQLNES